MPLSSLIPCASSNAILKELVSRSAPNCGEPSSTTLDIAEDVARPDTTALLDIFLRPPPEVSIARNTSSSATVDISLRAVTAVGLKFVPSAISNIPEVFVAIVKSSPDIVKSPAIVTSAPDIVSAVVVPDLTTRLPELLVNAPYCVPSSFNNTSAPFASRTTSPAVSIIKSPVSFTM